MAARCFHTIRCVLSRIVWTLDTGFIDLMKKLPAIQYPHPPAKIAAYVEALGYERSIEFLLAFGGAELYIPDNPSQKSELINVIGTQGVERLAERRHLFQRRVPLASPWLARCFRARGLSVASIARRLRLTDKTVRHYLNADRSDYGGKV